LEISDEDSGSPAENDTIINTPGGSQIKISGGSFALFKIPYAEGDQGIKLSILASDKSCRIYSIDKRELKLQLKNIIRMSIKSAGKTLNDYNEVSSSKSLEYKIMHGGVGNTYYIMIS